MQKFISVHETSLQEGLTHIRQWLGVDISDALYNINNGKGSRFGSLAALSRNAACRALLAFYADQDIANFKNWAFVAASIDKMTISEQLIGDYLIGDLCWAVLSDCEHLIEWYASSADLFASARMKNQLHNPKSWAFYRYQAYLALRGDLDQLASRAKDFLSMATQRTPSRWITCEYEFHVALGEGNLQAMEQALQDMVSPARRAKVYKNQNGLTCNLMEAYATLYAKIAWRHGYAIDIGSPWIPQLLMPVDQSVQYTDPWKIF